MSDLESRRARWAGHVRAWRHSGQSQSAYCQQHGLKVPTLAYWVQRIPAEATSGEPLTLLPVVRPAASGGEAPALVLQGPAGWSLTLPAGAPAAWVGTLLRHLA